MTAEERRQHKMEMILEARFAKMIYERDNVIYNYQQFYKWLNDQKWYKEHSKEARDFIKSLDTVETKGEYEV